MSGLERARDIAIIFLAGVALVFAIALTTYLFAVVLDKCCFGSKRLRERQAMLRELGDREMTTVRPPSRLEAQIVYKAGLSTMTRLERNRILSRFFTARSKLHKDLAPSDGSESDPGIASDNENAGVNVPADKGAEDSNTSIPQGSDDQNENATTINVESSDAEDPSNEGNAGNQIEGSDEQEEGGDENHEVTCSICLNGYADDDRVMTGTSCDHVFHYECAMQWMGKNHDHCAYCREDVITLEEFRTEALEVLGQERIDELEVKHKEAVEEAEAAAQARAESATASAQNAAADASVEEDSASPYAEGAAEETTPAVSAGAADGDDDEDDDVVPRVEEADRDEDIEPGLPAPQAEEAPANESDNAPGSGPEETPETSVVSVTIPESNQDLEQTAVDDDEDVDPEAVPSAADASPVDDNTSEAASASPKTSEVSTSDTSK